MLLVLLVSFYVGFTTGQVYTKKELSNPKAYFCRVDEEYVKRCFETVEDPYGRDEVTYKPRKF